MRSRFPLFAFGLAALAGTFGVVGCVENRSSLFIVGMTRGEPEGGSCTFEASLFIEKPITRGIYDLTFAAKNGYRVAFVVGNQLQPLGDDDTLRPETSRIQIEEVEVAIEPISDGAAVEGPSNYIVRMSSLVDTSEGEAPGLGVMWPELIPAGAITEEGEYELALILRGRTLGGTEIESGEFYFTIDARYGALAGIPDDLGSRLVPCFLGSDDGADCRCYYASGDPGYCGDQFGACPAD